MDNNAIKAKITQFIRSNFMMGNKSFTFTDDDSFLEKGIVDSSGILEVVGFVEKTFSIKIQDDELIPDNLDSINRLTAFVASKEK